MSVIIVAVLAIIGYQNVQAQLGMGPLNLDIIDSKPCEGDAGLVSIEVVNVGDKKGFNVEINLPFPMDESISYESRVDKIQNGQTQNGIFRIGGPYACKDFDKFLGKVWQKALEALGIPAGCPIQPGQYKAEKFTFDSKDIAIEKFFYGRFLVNLVMKQNGVTKVCHVIELTNNKPAGGGFGF